MTEMFCLKYLFFLTTGTISIKNKKYVFFAGLFFSVFFLKPSNCHVGMKACSKVLDSVCRS